MRNNLNVVTCSPKNVYIGNPMKNAEEIIRILDELENENPNVIVFPELCITGYTCGDLFNNNLLLQKSLEALVKIRKHEKKFDDAIIFVGMPFKLHNRLLNCAVAIHNEDILGIVPKTYIPNYNEFYEDRWFSSGKDINEEVDIIGGGFDIPVSTNIIFSFDEIKIACEICEDLWAPISPSSIHSQNGANVIVNLSASNDTVGKTKHREDLIRMHTAKNICSYIYTSASADESTTDVVFSGHQIIANNGKILVSDKDSEFNSYMINVDECIHDRVKVNSFMDAGSAFKKDYKEIKLERYSDIDNKYNKVSLTPFIPEHDLTDRVKEILHIQSTGLAQRMKKINCQKAVIGVSGGMDSTLALLVTVEAFKKNNYDLSNIIGITMPCFGTSNRTKNNSIKLMEALGITSMEISIKDSVTQHLKDMNHPLDLYDITFENAQARERTQVLMDMANYHNAIVVGTGDLSELALGWCTYNGDHMSMYAVNASIPKTLIRPIIEVYKDNFIGKGKDVLEDILETPISPELLPLNTDGTIAQKTESSIGSYLIHDFTLYYMIKYGMAPRDIYELYVHSSDVKLSLKDKIAVIDNMKTFYRRFFTQQFKRSCLPDGPKVGSISLSPRGDWKMASDANGELWLNEFDELKKSLELLTSSSTGIMTCEYVRLYADSIDDLVDEE